jgi:anti-sigma B factor antagonist
MIGKKEIGSYTVISVSGKLMGGPETAEFSEYVNGLQKSGVSNLILDLGDVQWINSAGIGALIASFMSFKAVGGVIRFANLSPKVRDVLQITKLAAVLEIYDSVESAERGSR